MARMGREICRDIKARLVLAVINGLCGLAMKTCVDFYDFDGLFSEVIWRGQRPVRANGDAT